MLQSLNSDMPPLDGQVQPSQIVFAGPVPIFEPHGTTLKLADLELYSLVIEPKGTPFQLPPATATLTLIPSRELISNPGSVLPLLPGDPLATEQFCLVLTAGFSLVMVLGEDYSGCSVSVFF